MKRTVFLLIAISLLVVGCDKDPVPTTPPIAAFKVQPENGLTTTVFQFNATETKATDDRDTILFLRWDWDNDSIWDTGFSRAKSFKHRYYQPGTYTARLEARNDAGQSDTVQITINVGQGNSAPQPHLNVNPLSGNLRTVFHCDGSMTRDDEDSLNTLKFRWDFNGDGIWDTEYAEENRADYLFSNAGQYYITMNVVDPKGLTATINQPVIVSLSNPNLVPEFTWNPDRPTTADTILFDASQSYDPEHPDNFFTYRWSFTQDGTWETGYQSDPTIRHNFEDEGEQFVTLEIRDQWGLINQKQTPIWVYHANKKPTATFFAGCDHGNLTTNFYFDADGIHDMEDLRDQLRVRWDLDGDGNWDTDYSKERIIRHSYTQPGTYVVTLEVIDSGGLTDETWITVTVTDGTNPTDLIIDKAKDIFYGTVKIGDQWWTSENMNHGSGRNCYARQSSNCNIYGGLYSWTSAMVGATTEKAKGICPDGWHIPTTAEWQELVDYLGVDQARSRLEVGGDTDFMMKYAGQRDTYNHYDHLGFLANYWTSTKSAGENAWMYSFQNDKEDPYKIVLSHTYLFSVRCIKN